MSMRRPRMAGETVAEAMDAVLWDYAPERERTPRGYSAGDFFDGFSWAEREGAEADRGEEDEERKPSAGEIGGEPLRSPE